MANNREIDQKMLAKVDSALEKARKAGAEYEVSEMLIQLYQAGAIDKEELREELAEWSGRHGVFTKLKAKKEGTDCEDKQQG